MPSLYTAQRWTFKGPGGSGLEETTFLLVRYEHQHAAISNLSSPGDDGLYFARSLQAPYAGRLGNDRPEMFEKLRMLLTWMNGRPADVIAGPSIPAITTEPGTQHASPMVEGSPFSIEERAVTPMVRGYLGVSPTYGRLMYRDGKGSMRPATIADLRALGIDPGRVKP